jgi:DNA repair protein RadC
MRIDDWPAAERPGEKLLAAGAQALSESWLLAIWLRTATRGTNAVELARRAPSFATGTTRCSAADISACYISA